MAFRRQHVNPDSLPAVLCHKWTAEVLGEGFVPLPKRLLRVIPKLIRGRDSLECLMVLLALIDCRRPGQADRVSTAYLAFLTGLDRLAVSRAVAELRDAGLLIVAEDAGWLEFNLEPLFRKILDLSASGENAGP